jgi:hypothetical protein
MTVEVRWSSVCDADVRRIPFRTAERVCAAVYEFARTGEGPVEQITDGVPSSFAIRVRGAVALARFDMESGGIFVMRIYGTR